MADRWIGLCRDEATEDVRRALTHIDPTARLSFASSPQDMRETLHSSRACMGAIVGPMDGRLSSLNIAAALVHDAMAEDVALVVPGLTKSVRERAARAGIMTVIDLSALITKPIDDLDEALVSQDDVPTMVWGQATRQEIAPPHVAQPAAATSPDMLTIPMIRGGARGPQIESVSVPRPHADRDGKEGAQDLPFDTQEGNGSVAPIITFVSGRGGVGKTSLVAMMGTIAASWGMRVAICDLDLSCGNLYGCLGLPDGCDLSDIVANGPVANTDIIDAGSRVSERLALWGPCDLPEMAEVVYPEVEHVLTALSRAHDLVLVDTSTTFTDAVAQAAQQCDRLVITVDGRPGSASSQARIAAFAVRLGVARTRLVRLANRCGAHGRGVPTINRAEVGLETARPLRVLDGGAEVAECMAEGKVSDLMDLGSRFAESAGSALAGLLSELGCLPQDAEAQRALEEPQDRSRWSFGRKRGA